MDLQDNIKKVTLLPSLEENARFFRLQGLSQAAKDRKMNERKVKKPRNIEVLEDSYDSFDDYVNDNITNKCTFDKCAISAAIKEVNGGLDFSNKHWERYWSKRLEDLTKSEREKSQNSSACDSIKTYPENQTAITNLENKPIKQKSKIFKNAAVMGLVNTKKISLEYLFSPSNENLIQKENKLGDLDRFTSSNAAVDNKIELIPLREDPEVFVHPLRLGIDYTKFKDIDFTIPHVGKKTKETPRQYFLRTTNDDFFDFVKKEKSTK